MKTTCTTKPLEQLDADWLVVGVLETDGLSGQLVAIDAALDGQIQRMHDAGDLTGKAGERVIVHQPSGISASRLLLIGLGHADAVNADQLEKSMMIAARRISEKAVAGVTVALPETNDTGIPAAISAQRIGIAFAVGCVGQDLYRTERSRFAFDDLTLAVDHDDRKVTSALRKGIELGVAVNLARELVNGAPQDIYPESFADRAQQLAKECGLTCRVLDESHLQTERMNAMLAVARGSVRPPRLVVLEHRHAGDNAPVLALVGKGVTFDSGGLSLKPSDSMKTMKCDMAGAATVLAAMTAIAKQKRKVNVIGLMGLVENMPGGNSYKLGDVLTARNGVTIEVLNTDAEGRLVLADVLSYAVDLGATKLVDLATLTGSCVVALGEDVSGAFTNDQAWCDTVIETARECNDPIWQLPMYDHFRDLIKGDVSDIKNVGPRWGGAITAAKFLEHFVGDTPWVHLDIAGPSFASSSKPWREAGGTGCMVRTLVQLAASL